MICSIFPDPVRTWNQEKGGLASWPRSGCWAIRNMVTRIYYRLSFRDRISKWLPKVNPPHLWDISFPKLQAAWLCFSGEWNWDKDHWMPDLQWLCGKTYQIGQGTKGWFLLIVWKKLPTSTNSMRNGTKIHHKFWSCVLLHHAAAQPPSSWDRVLLVRHTA